ncbi:hypothetical protein FNH22_00075 [Fulvivirga sp. M361]|uniref:DUF6515 family protein n=1 Tax=Fulvivirga sp. M361 TaxID=2594266 RepID=UPI00117B8362|nr:DUF6515 family protein [Fulvivirga sp. M361]TRX62529.1 hypothetical protein FNH22_00075 [Fulvivirga sp. M361]
MKKLFLTIALLIAVFFAPQVVLEANAQTSRDVVVVKKRNGQQRRTVRRRTRRKVRRRVTRRAHYAYRHLPRYRAVVKVAPKGAVVVKRNNVVYRYHDGLFYTSNKSGFIVTRPVVGIRVRILPAAHHRMVIANNTYYYYYGTFYIQKENEYEVTSAPEGAVVDALPDGYEVKNVDNTEYYVLDGVYYQEVETDEVESGVGYEVVSI